MTDPKPDGFQPAPWEAGKRNTQGPQGAPPGHGAPQPPPAPPGRPTRQSVPLGGGPAPNAFGGDMGRGRTRPIPNQPPQGGPTGPTLGQPFQPQQGNPEQYPEPPAYGGGPPPQQGGYPPPAQGYPPGPQGAPPQGAPPQGMPPGAPPQQPYGDQGYSTKKPTTVMGIIALALAGVGALTALVTLGFFSWPFFIIGGVLGYLGIRETAAWGRKSGRGLAMSGTIANGALLVLNIAGVITLFALGNAVGNMVEQQNNAVLRDGPMIVKRVGMYKQAKGDLLPGGPQMRTGYENSTAVTGSQLTVPDLCTPAELQNPIEQYSLTIDGETATVWWSPPDGERQEVGVYGGIANFDDFSFDDDFPPPPEGMTPAPPGRQR